MIGSQFVGLVGEQQVNTIISLHLPHTLGSSTLFAKFYLNMLLVLNSMKNKEFRYITNWLAYLLIREAAVNQILLITQPSHTNICVVLGIFTHTIWEAILQNTTIDTKKAIP